MSWLPNSRSVPTNCQSSRGLTPANGQVLLDLALTHAVQRCSTLHVLRKRGLVQVRHTRVLMEPDDYDIWEVRLVITESGTDSFKASVHNLIESMAPVVRKLLAKEIAEVQYHMNKEKENVANG